MRGILQGDSLSPLLFVLCLDPLSRRLNGTYPKVSIPLNDVSYSTNHLLFIDDLKLFAENEGTARKLLDETKEFFKTIGLEMNKEKSATNARSCLDDATLLDDHQGYKYLGITEAHQSKISSESLIRIKQELFKRVERLTKTNLSGKIFSEL
ncbi:Retrovirus-related Pol polyprotein from type-2 retrotransposable element R2DM [Nosema granulosis]|uniref:Retrovirus-related Pol polyprotein from type-2 retrotransposable element R2DM n=1 Tax=Nosema granulosis TaxID=83296 RepID=A0A9P6GVG5_9MICR|nr:Retrovirus-related Pol polyprotein from type-2 retrotransposable element R2DM [Nosema granulosis]